MNDVKRYYCVDLTKFIMAIFVVAWHLHPALGISDSYDFYISGGIVRIAVPFFFVASGFFFFRKIDLYDLKWKYVKKYCHRLLIMYLIWSAVYLPISLNKIYKADDHLQAFVDYILDFIFDGSFYHLWYLPGSVIAVLFIWYLLKKKISLKNIVYIGLLFYIIPMLGRGYYRLYSVIFPEESYVNNIMLAIGNVIYPVNGLTEGVLYMTLGALVAKGSFNYSRKIVIVGCFISWILWNTENVLLYEYGISNMGNSASLTMIPAVLFIFLLTTKIRLCSGIDWIMLREMSLYIYLIHPMFQFIYRGMYRKIIGYEMPNMQGFILVLFTTLLVSYVIVKWKRGRSR